REASADAAYPAVRPGPPSEREMALPVVRRLVDVHPAGPRSLGEPQAAAKVFREHGGQEPVRRRVDDRKRLVLAPDRRNWHDRTERLLAGDLHFIAHAVEDSRLVVQVRGKPRRAGAAGD